MSTNVLIGYRNLADLATTTLSNGSWSADAPQANLLTADVTETARTADAANASTIISWDLGSAMAIDAIAIPNHSMTTAAQHRLSLGSSAGGTEVHAGAQANVFLVSGDGRTGLDFMLVIPLPARPSARYGKLELFDAANPDGHLDLGRLVIAQGLIPAVNASWNLGNGWGSASRKARTDGGRRQSWSGRRWRYVELALDWLTDAEGDTVHDIQRVCGTDRDVLYLPDLDDAAACQRYGIWGPIDELSPIRYPMLDTRTVALRIEDR